MAETMDRTFGIVVEVEVGEDEDESSSTDEIDFPCTLSDILNRKAVIGVYVGEERNVSWSW